MFSAATPVLLIQGEGKVRLVEMVGINKSSYPRYSESLILIRVMGRACSFSV